ncbi:bifunctional UDP-N-acetylglucosamine diphosphorylase/glucosamine-1-phosphate N-acetyltransferase GlmU [Candidatus Babeliales bacterium]|nr:bifunctional UDP-N-acetylglucosamine diphosphorylase/glucosamine-1-phosphate N-acetyltransferase GlmU [Candidatus Babeliales bacterium]
MKKHLRLNRIKKNKNLQGACLMEKNEHNRFNSRVDAIVLAAGKSSRFKSATSKLLFPLCGKPLILHLLTSLKELQLQPLLVTGHQEENIRALLDSDSSFSSLKTITQLEQKGTGHATLIALPHINNDFTLIINGDMPLLSSKSLSQFISNHVKSDSDMSIGTAIASDPHSYGRLIKTDISCYIQEEKNCSDEEKLCRTINAGIYIFKTSILKKYINEVEHDIKSGEFFLPDVVNRALNNNGSLQIFQFDFDEIKGINRLSEAHEIQKILRRKIINHWIDQGVWFTQPETVEIDINCNIGSYTKIEAGVIISNNTTIAQHAKIGAYSILDHAQIDSDVQILPHSIIKNSKIEASATVGPFAHIHTTSHLHKSTRIGNFVEVKKSSIGKQSKAKHLSYLGDTTIGSNVNIGAGTITCNYDGFTKHKTIIYDNVSIGAQNALVAPVTIQQGSMTAAGSTITDDVPAESLGIGRARQVNKENYVRLRKQKHREEKELILTETHQTTEKKTDV